MVDVTEDFLIKAKTYLGEEGKRVRNYFCCGLQDFSPEPNSYDVIWIQWVIGELLAALSTSHTPPAAEVGPPPTALRPWGPLQQAGRWGFLWSSLGPPGRWETFPASTLSVLCQYLL